MEKLSLRSQDWLETGKVHICLGKHESKTCGKDLTCPFQTSLEKPLIEKFLTKKPIIWLNE